MPDSQQQHHKTPLPCREHYESVQRLFVKFDALAERISSLTAQSVEATQQHEQLNQNLAGLLHLYNGNGKPPLAVRLDRLENHMGAEHRQADRFAGAIVTVVVALVIAAITAVATLAWTGAGL